MIYDFGLLYLYPYIR